MFIHCKIASMVWNLVAGWLQVCETSHAEPLNHFLQHGGYYSGKKKRKIRYIIWLGVTWGARERRRVQIEEGTFLFKSEKILSWQWFKERVGRNINLVYEQWCDTPLSCRNSV